MKELYQLGETPPLGEVPARMLEKQDGYVVAATVTNHFIQELQ